MPNFITTLEIFQMLFFPLTTNLYLYRLQFYVYHFFWKFTFRTNDYVLLILTIACNVRRQYCFVMRSSVTGSKSGRRYFRTRCLHTVKYLYLCKRYQCAEVQRELLVNVRYFSNPRCGHIVIITMTAVIIIVVRWTVWSRIMCNVYQRWGFTYMQIYKSIYKTVAL